MKNIEGPWKCRDHEESHHLNWVDQYRFDVLLADGSIGSGCSPLHIPLFDAAKSFLKGKSAGQFALLEEHEQEAMVKGIIDKIPYVEISVCITAGRPVIEQLQYVEVENRTPVSNKKQGYGTPREEKGSVSFATPTSSFPGRYSGSSSGRHSAVEPEEFETPKKRLKDIEAQFAAMKCGLGE